MARRPSCLRTYTSSLVCP
ncbi:hypothetical protein LINPERPRIM_LOCUS37179 [Linum perenne]